MINYPRSLQSDLSFSWRRSGLQVRMCFSSFVNRQPLRGLQTALLTVPEHRGCSGWQKRKGDVSHERREKKGGEGKLAKNNPNSSTLKFWMRFCQGSGNWKGKCICFLTDCLFSAWWWQKYTKQYGPVWNYLKATRISLVQSAELKWSWLVIGSGDQLRLLCSVRAVCSCQFPSNKTQITVCNLKKKTLLWGFLNYFLLQNKFRQLFENPNRFWRHLNLPGWFRDCCYYSVTLF